MKFYVMASAERREEVAAFYDKLRARGHEIVADWTTGDDINPPFDARPEVTSFVERDVAGVLEADVIVKLSGKREGIGSNFKFGMGVAAFVIRGKPLVYATAEDTSGNPYYFHSAVRVRKDLDSVLEEVEREAAKKN